MWKKVLEEWSGALTNFGTASLLIIGGISLVFTLLLHSIGRYIGPALENSELKLSNYTCGEDPSTMTGTLDVRRLFVFTLYFLVFDSAAFILSLALAPGDYAPAIFIGILAITTTMLVAKWRRGFGNS